MIAAKAFDPVVGIDIHIIQPPGPVPPLPVPHPFIGILLDPFDFAPIIGSTVSVNGLPRATAGTGGRCLPPHIPIGGVFVKSPANECDVFMGSATVLADDEPLSFLGMPALSCHCIGMPPIPRLKKKRRVKSLVLPTSFVIAIPMGMPVLVGGPPTISMMALGMRAGMAALGKAFKKLRKLQKASRRIKAMSDRVHNAAKKAMNKLGVPPSVQNRIHRAVCTVTGHPVDVATGKLYTEAIDFELPGPIPFVWERVWYSCSTYDGSLGHGWHHAYDLALLEEDGSVAVRLPDGRPVAFAIPPEGGISHDDHERLSLSRDKEGYALRDRRGQTWRFAPLRSNPVQSLVRIVDDAGVQVCFEYDANRRLARAVDSIGNQIQFGHDDGGRISELRVWRVDGAPPGQTVVRYEYSEQGDLVTAVDALGQPFHYAYRSHQLVRETDRRGYSFVFRYDRDTPDARCVATSGEDGLFHVELVYAADQTTATFDDGGAWLYRHDGKGVVTDRVDPYGGVTHFDHDAAGQVVEEVDPSGNSTKFEYDDAGDLIRRINAVGHATHVHPGEDEEDTPSRDPNGYELPDSSRGWEYGRIAAVGTDAGPEERLIAQLPSSVLDRLRGNRASGTLPAEPADELDMLDRLVRRHYGDRTSESWTYDPEGNVIVYEDRDGAVTRNVYGSRNLLVEQTDPLGHITQYTYSRSLEMTGVVDAGGTVHAFQHDLKDRHVQVRTEGRAADHYAYDAADNLVEHRDEEGNALVRFEIGPGNVLASRVLADGDAHRFEYDERGQIISADTSTVATRFTYGNEGTLLEDLRTGTGVQHAREASTGIGRTTLLGRFVVGYWRDPVDPHVLVIKDPTGAAHTFRSGWDGDVLKRLANGTSELARYDPDGRCIEKHRWRAGGMAASHQRFVYTPAGDLREVDDLKGGTARYEYDAAHRLRRETRGDGTWCDYKFDPVGNLLQQPGLTGVAVGSRNQLARANGDSLTYDRRGRLAARTGSSGSVRYEYNTLDQLIRIERGGEVWHASYDAFGRRVSKTWRGRTTEYWWDGFRLAAERIPDGTLRLYVYPDNEALVPFMFVEYATTDLMPAGGRRYFVFSNHIGVPVRVEDDDGGSVWTARIDPFGSAQVGTNEGIAMWLRFPGHYFDAETGLHYNRFRYYSPELGRYLQPDPLGFEDSINVYAYSPNPLVEVDIDGLKKSYTGGKPKTKKPKTKSKTGATKKSKPKTKAKPKAKKPKVKKDKRGRLRDSEGRYARDPKAKKGKRHSRSSEYPHGNDPAVRDRVIAKHSQNGKVIDPETGKPIPRDQVTIEHKQKVVTHYNKKGYNQTRDQRKQWYNDEDNLTVKPRGPNSAEGASCGETFRQDNGPNYD